MTPLEKHQTDIQENLWHWRNKPLLQEIYAGFHRRISSQIDSGIPGHIVEIGSGIGNLKASCPDSIITDLFPNPWLDLICDGYALPFQSGSLSHLVLVDVFHHLSAPKAFLREAQRVLGPGGRLILLEPYISLASYPVYGLLHRESVGLSKEIFFGDMPPRPRDYHAAQGNATRLFFWKQHPGWLDGWKVSHAEAFSAFSYLLSGGYSKPAFYPLSCLPVLQKLDEALSRWPNIFAARCLVTITTK
jgi:SAM-dependent methyltransferase